MRWKRCAASPTTSPPGDLNDYKADLGFGLLLKKYVADVNQATPAIIDKAVNDTVPRVTPMFWAFRLMVGLGMACWCCSAGPGHAQAAAAGSPGCCLVGCCRCRGLPARGWFVAEYGRQPWTIYGVLPTHLSVSTLSVESLWPALPASSASTPCCWWSRCI
jgi:cytochrome d ubiquinol oxidase subunit I